MLNLDLPATRLMEAEVEKELEDDFETEEELDEDFVAELAEDVDLETDLTVEFKSSDEISRYLADIHKFPRLTQNEEVELAKAILAGKQSTDPKVISAGMQAREKFINANYKLVVAVAKQYKYSCTASLTFMDLIQSGNLGLMHAVDRFDYTKGWKFSTYATWWVKQRIRREIQDNANVIRVPVHVQDWLSKIHKLELQAGRDLSPAELVEALNITLTKAEWFLQIRANMPLVYLDRIVATEDSEASLLDVIPSHVLSPAQVYDDEERETYLMTVLNDKLTDREFYIVMERFGFIDDKPKSLEVLGKALGLTRERVRQIESRALQKLKRLNLQHEFRRLLK